MVLVLLGAGVALALHRSPTPLHRPGPPPRSEAFERARREQRLAEAADTVRLLRGLEAHLAERNAGP